MPELSQGLGCLWSHHLLGQLWLLLAQHPHHLRFENGGCWVLHWLVVEVEIVVSKVRPPRALDKPIARCGHVVVGLVSEAVPGGVRH